MTNSYVGGSLLCLLVVAGACQHHEFEREFFSHLGERVERSRQLTLEEQYKVFRYGNDVMHPPFMDLADPIAERGSAAVPFLLQQLETDRTDIGARDIVLVFTRMAGLKTYDVKSDRGTLSILRARVAQMKDKEWREISSNMLQRIVES